ncbi:hypothetical protein BS78_04G300600 [Paspalum vaginatum]|nr:hypothetical protein BS78_04G300600 [Paspalum vaginatum]
MCHRGVVDGCSPGVSGGGGGASASGGGRRVSDVGPATTVDGNHVVVGDRAGCSNTEGVQIAPLEGQGCCSKAAAAAQSKAWENEDPLLLTILSSTTARDGPTAPDPMLFEVELGSSIEAWQGRVGPLEGAPQTQTSFASPVQLPQPKMADAFGQSSRGSVEAVPMSCQPTETNAAGAPADAVDEPLLTLVTACSPAEGVVHESQLDVNRPTQLDEPDIEEFFSSLQVPTSSLLPAPTLEAAPEVAGPPLRSKRIAAQKLAGVPVAKRGELIVMKRLGYEVSVPCPTEDEVKKYNSIYHGSMATGHREAISELIPELFPARHKGGRRATATTA